MRFFNNKDSYTVQLFVGDIIRFNETHKRNAVREFCAFNFDKKTGALKQYTCEDTADNRKALAAHAQVYGANRLDELESASVLTKGECNEMVRDLQQACIDYRARTGRDLDDDETTNVLNMWISRLGGERR